MRVLSSDRILTDLPNKHPKSGSVAADRLRCASFYIERRGAQWLSDRVLDSRPRGRGVEPHWRYCVVSFSKTHLSLLRTGSTPEDPSRHN